MRLTVLQSLDFSQLKKPNEQLAFAESADFVFLALDDWTTGNIALVRASKSDISRTAKRIPVATLGPITVSSVVAIANLSLRKQLLLSAFNQLWIVNYDGSIVSKLAVTLTGQVQSIVIDEQRDFAIVTVDNSVIVAVDLSTGASVAHSAGFQFAETNCVQGRRRHLDWRCCALPYIVTVSFT